MQVLGRRFTALAPFCLPSPKERLAFTGHCMVLSLRRTRLEKQPVFADLQDWQVLEDGNEIGHVYEQHAPASPDQAWVWSITVPLDMRAKVVTSGRAPTIDQAKQDFLKSWSAWTAWLAR